MISEMCKNENPLGFLYTFKHNMIWTLGFIIALNFTHFDFNKSFQNFDLAPDHVKKWPWYGFYFLFWFIALIIVLISFLLSQFVLAGKLVFFYHLMNLIIWATFVSMMTYTFNKEIHIHHYFIGLNLVFLFNHHNFLVTLVHSIGCGIMIEGSTRWGQDANWSMGMRSLND